MRASSCFCSRKKRISSLKVRMSSASAASALSFRDAKIISDLLCGPSSVDLPLLVSIVFSDSGRGLHTSTVVFCLNHQSLLSVSPPIAKFHAPEISRPTSKTSHKHVHSSQDMPLAIPIRPDTASPLEICRTSSGTVFKWLLCLADGWAQTRVHTHKCNGELCTTCVSGFLADDDWKTYSTTSHTSLRIFVFVEYKLLEVSKSHGSARGWTWLGRPASGS